MIKSKNYLLIIVLIVFLSRAGISQPWYFNNLYNPNNTWCAGLSIESDSSGYMACAISGDVYNYYQICITKLANDGTLLYFKNFGQSGMDYYPGENGAFKQDDQGRYYLFGSVDYFNYIVKGLFIYFDVNGDTIFSRKYESLYTTRLAGRNCVKTHDNGFILTGDENITDSSGVDFYILKIDSLGNEEWRDHYGMNNGDIPYSIIQTPDLGYAIGGLTFSGPQITYDPLIIKTDSLGELEWMLNLGGEYKDDKAVVCNTLDSCIMVLTAYADSMRTPEHAYTKINLIKISINGEIIWNKKYGPSKPVNYISNIKSAQNGGFILCGYSMLDAYLPSAGWIMEVNSEGDSLWYRDYNYYPQNPDYPHNYLYDISLAGDHGFIATGQAYTLFGQNPSQNMWIMKVDSIGCEIPNCWVGIEEEDKTVRRYDDKKGMLEIWPNPASGEIHVRWNMDDGRFYRDCELVIYDVFGREVAEIILPDKQDQIQINVESYPPGVYIVILRKGHILLESSKFVVVK